MRNELLEFVNEMQAQLKANEHRGDWRKWEDALTEGPFGITRNLRDYGKAKHGTDDERRTLVDIANFALMMWVQSKRHKSPAPEKEGRHE